MGSVLLGKTSAIPGDASFFCLVDSGWLVSVAIQTRGFGEARGLTRLRFEVKVESFVRATKPNF